MLYLVYRLLGSNGLSPISVGELEFGFELLWLLSGLWCKDNDEEFGISNFNFFSGGWYPL